MSITLRKLDANAQLANHQTTIRQSEGLAFRLVLISIGHESGNKANLVAFSDDIVGNANPIQLEVIDGGLDQAAQEALLNQAGRVLVCYSSLYVGGKPQNVAAYRES
jgi:hypothetical protein